MMKIYVVPGTERLATVKGWNPETDIACRSGLVCDPVTFKPRHGRDVFVVPQRKLFAAITTTCDHSRCPTSGARTGSSPGLIFIKSGESGTVTPSAWA